MGGLFRRHELDAFVSQGPQVNGIEQPLEPALKRALLESGGAFEELVKAAKDWEAAHRD